MKAIYPIKKSVFSYPNTYLDDIYLNFIQKNDRHALLELVKGDKNAVNSLLEMCCYLGNINMIEFLLSEYNVDVNHLIKFSVDTYNMSGPMYDVIKYLLDFGVDVHTENDILIRTASNMPDYKLLKLLIDYGADINTDNNYPFNYCIAIGNIDCVKLFLECNIDITANDDYALRISAKYQKYQIIKLLIDNGANIHADDNYVLRICTQYGDYDMVKYLIGMGANIHDNNDSTLIIAIRYDRFEIVKLLLDCGGDIEALKSYKLNNPSTYTQKLIDLVNLLIQKEVSIDQIIMLKWGNDKIINDEKILLDI